MSANDLIRRIDAVKAVRWGDSVTEAHNKIRDIPAVPQEMSAREYETGWHSLCTHYSKYLCKGCPLDDGEQCGVPTKCHRAIVEKWAQEHPERSEE